jgi:hypothetical protein
MGGGAVLVALLAVLVDLVLSVSQRMLVSPGLAPTRPSAAVDPTHASDTDPDTDPSSDPTDQSVAPSGTALQGDSR